MAAALGTRGAAVEYLREAARLRDPFSTFALTLPGTDRRRNLAEYQQILTGSTLGSRTELPLRWSPAVGAESGRPAECRLPRVPHDTKRSINAL